MSIHYLPISSYLVCFSILFSLEQALKLSIDSMTQLWRLRMAVLKDPEQALEDFCNQQDDTNSVKISFQCKVEMYWREEADFGNPCSDDALDSYRARRFWKLQTVCRFKVFSTTFNISPLSFVFLR